MRERIKKEEKGKRKDAKRSQGNVRPYLSTKVLAYLRFPLFLFSNNVTKVFLPEDRDADKPENDDQCGYILKQADDNWFVSDHWDSWGFSSKKRQQVGICPVDSPNAWGISSKIKRFGVFQATLGYFRQNKTVWGISSNFFLSGVFQATSHPSCSPPPYCGLHVAKSL